MRAGKGKRGKDERGEEGKRRRVPRGGGVDEV